jgi:hypothetical protein
LTSFCCPVRAGCAPQNSPFVSHFWGGDTTRRKKRKKTRGDRQTMTRRIRTVWLTPCSESQHSAELLPPSASHSRFSVHLDRPCIFVLGPKLRRAFPRVYHGCDANVQSMYVCISTPLSSISSRFPRRSYEKPAARQLLDVVRGYP